MKKFLLPLAFISLLIAFFALSACAKDNDFKLFTAKELVTIMPATKGSKGYQSVTKYNNTNYDHGICEISFTK